jgi:hypothetical protein
VAFFSPERHRLRSQQLAAAPLEGAFCLVQRPHPHVLLLRAEPLLGRGAVQILHLQADSQLHAGVSRSVPDLQAVYLLFPAAQVFDSFWLFRADY